MNAPWPANPGVTMLRGLQHVLAEQPARRRAAVLGILERTIADLDQRIESQLNAILHHPRFQKLEASWRGVAYLVAAIGVKERIKVKLLNVTWRSICRDLERAIEFDQSQLFDKVYDEEFGIPGGEPYGVLLMDYEIQHTPTADKPTDDVSTLKRLAEVAAAAFAPIIIGASPALLGVERFSDLGATTDFHGMFQQPEYARWRGLQESDDSRFMGITMPHVLMRTPYRDVGRRRDTLRFHEDVDPLSGDNYLWGSAIYAFGRTLIRAFSSFGWFADIRGARRGSISGGLVTDLPVDSFHTDREGAAMKFSTDVSLTETQDIALSDSGVIPLLNCKDSPYSAFYSNQSLQVPRRYGAEAARVNARMSTMLQYVLCVSRFAHYVKVMGRDKVGSFASPEDCERQLAEWLRGYVDASDDGSEDRRARYPLREARVIVREPPGRPGQYFATVHLRPHFQLDQLASAFELVTEMRSAQRS